MGGRIVVLVSGSGSNMVALVEACERADVPAEVVAVLADRECGGIDAARSRGVNAEIVDFKGFDSRDAWGQALLEKVAGCSPDLVVSAGFMRILDDRFVDEFEGRLINLHPALLPAFPGAHAVRDALEHGAKVTGTTLHFVDREVDHGPIILQEALRIEPGDDEGSLHGRIKAIEHRLLPHACRLILEGKVVVENGRVAIRD